MSYTEIGFGDQTLILVRLSKLIVVVCGMNSIR